MKQAKQMQLVPGAGAPEDEDFVGRISKVCIAEARGRSQVTISQAVMSRYRLRLWLRYNGRKRSRMGLHIVDVDAELEGS